MNRWFNVALAPHEQNRLASLQAFLEGRLSERGTIDWALKEAANDRIRQLAILSLLEHPRTDLKEPWRSAWRLIEEAWEDTQTDTADLRIYTLEKRINAGERSGALVRDITRLVGPRLEVEAISRPSLKKGRPTRPQQLLSARIGSHRLIDPQRLNLQGIDDAAFLSALGRSLEAALREGIEMARRLGWGDGPTSWFMGNVRRVYFVDGHMDNGDDRDPDTYAEGLAPVVKTLHAVVHRLVQLDSTRAREFTNRWTYETTPLLVRLWASLASDDGLVSAEKLSERLEKLSDNEFWDLHHFPEVAELRARRFGQLTPESQQQLALRLTRKPPRSIWGRNAEREKVEEARIYWAARELRRIETVGWALPEKAQSWLAAHVAAFEDLAGEVSLAEGFLDGVRVHSRDEPQPGTVYEGLQGVVLLDRLEADLKAGRRHWDDDPAGGAGAWIEQNALAVLEALDATPDVGADYSNIWERLGWAHKPAEEGAVDEGRLVLKLLAELHPDTVRGAMEGLTYWLSSWSSRLSKQKELLTVWQRIWPLAVEATNHSQSGEVEADLNVVGQGPTNDEPVDLDTLNTPAGRMVSVFFSLWAANKRKRVFEKGSALQIMRDAIVAAEGRSGLIAKHRLLEYLVFFQRAAPRWTKSHLLPLLQDESADSIPLWRAVARRTLFADNIALIGDVIIRRALDARVGRKSRESLVFSIIVSSLHALFNDAEPPLPYAAVTQMLRSLDDEVRAHAATALYRFVRDLSKPRKDSDGTPPERLFDEAAAPFLEKVWPQEQSLTSAGVSQALAHLPAVTGARFTQAVAKIERFLVPFSCWSLLEYNLHGEGDDGEARLEAINSPDKARALLTLLNLTIGSAEDAVVPYDLGKVLEQVRSTSPALEVTPDFRRLMTLAR